jgi:hypothetical protein
MCVVPNMAVFCTSLTSWFPGTVLTYLLLLLLLLLTAIELSLCSTTEKPIIKYLHKRNNTNHSKYKYTYYQNQHTLQNPQIHTQQTLVMLTASFTDILNHKHNSMGCRLFT